MTIDILSIPDCPNHAPTVAPVRAVLSTASISADVREVFVTNAAEAHARGFMGSPTVLVNGNDLEAFEATDIGLFCRVYGGGSGVPPNDLLRRAIDAARHVEQGR